MINILIGLCVINLIFLKCYGNLFIHPEITLKKYAHVNDKFENSVFLNPFDDNYDLNSTSKNVNYKFPIDDYQYHGTTTLSFKCKDCIIVAIDSRASMGTYVGSRTVKKIFPISNNIIATMAGGAADCAYWIRRISRLVKVYEYDYDTKLSVGSVAKLLANTLREYRGAGLSVGTMVAGVNGNNESEIYYVDSEGSLVKGEIFCVGSGSKLAYAILDKENLLSLTKEKAIHVAKWAIRHATYRDGYSGGFINIFCLDAKGIEHVMRIDSKELII